LQTFAAFILFYFILHVQAALLEKVIVEVVPTNNNKLLKNFDKWLQIRRQAYMEKFNVTPDYVSLVTELEYRRKYCREITQSHFCKNTTTHWGT